MDHRLELALNSWKKRPRSYWTVGAGYLMWRWQNKNDVNTEVSLLSARCIVWMLGSGSDDRSTYVTYQSVVRIWYRNNGFRCSAHMLLRFLHWTPVCHSFFFLSVGLISRLISLLIGVYVLVSICFVQVLVIRYVWQTKLSGSLVNFLAYVMHF